MSDLQPGQHIGPCRIISTIGAGGMGAVYLAEHTRLGKQVALKVLSGQFLTDPEYVARFQREASSLAQLDHPNIAALLDFGEDAGQHYMLTQYVPGGSLKERIAASGRQPWSQMRRLAEQLLQALAYAHAKGFVHRDIKPANILLDEQGNARVVDFGLVRGLAAGGLTLTGEAMGTPHYMSPEQWDGADPDPRMDLWALGVTLHHALTGQVPFGGTEPTKVMKGIVLSPHPTLADCGITDAPPALQAFLDRLLAKEPADRFASAEAALQALDDLASGKQSAPASAPRPMADVDRTVKARQRSVVNIQGRGGPEATADSTPEPNPRSAAKMLILILLLVGLSALACGTALWIERRDINSADSSSRPSECQDSGRQSPRWPSPSHTSNGAPDTSGFERNGFVAAGRSAAHPEPDSLASGSSQPLPTDAHANHEPETARPTSGKQVPDPAPDPAPDSTLAIFATDVINAHKEGRALRADTFRKLCLSIAKQSPQESIRALDGWLSIYEEQKGELRVGADIIICALLDHISKSQVIQAFRAIDTKALTKMARLLSQGDALQSLSAIEIAQSIDALSHVIGDVVSILSFDKELDTAYQLCEAGYRLTMQSNIMSPESLPSRRTARIASSVFVPGLSHYASARGPSAALRALIFAANRLQNISASDLSKVHRCLRILANIESCFDECVQRQPLRIGPAWAFAVGIFESAEIVQSCLADETLRPIVASAACYLDRRLLVTAAQTLASKDANQSGVDAYIMAEKICPFLNDPAAIAALQKESKQSEEGLLREAVRIMDLSTQTLENKGAEAVVDAAILLDFLMSRAGQDTSVARKMEALYQCLALKNDGAMSDTNEHTGGETP